MTDNIKKEIKQMDKIVNETVNELVGIMTNVNDRRFYIYLHKLCGYNISFHGTTVTLTEDMLLGGITNNECFESIYNDIIEKLKQNQVIVKGEINLNTNNLYSYDSFKVKMDLFRRTYSNVYNAMVEYVFSLPYGKVLFDKEAITAILLKDKKLKNIIEIYNK